MARTRTYSRTVSLPSLILIRIQVATALRRGAGIENSSLEKIKRGLNEHWIRDVIIYGVDAEALCRAEFVISIDWAANSVRVEAGHDLVEVGSGWTDNVAPEISEMVSEFAGFCEARRLSRDWRVRYEKGVDTPMVRRELGFSPSVPPTWAGRTVALSERVHGLGEVEATVRFVEE